MFKDRIGVFYILFPLAVASCFAYLTFSHTTASPIIKDARENVVAAYHLVHTGVVGADKEETDTPRQQMRREPLPIVVIAGFLLVHPAFAKPYTIAELTNGPLTESVKGVNALWRFLCAAFIFLLCMELFPNRRVAGAMAVTCLILSEFWFFTQPRIVDRIYTELPEVALMLLASWSAIRFVRGQTIPRAIWLGVVLGALALTKTAFLYIGIGFILLLFLVDGLKLDRSEPQRSSFKTLAAAYAAVLLAMLLTLAPWIARNAIVFGKPQIVSGTEGYVLGERMLLTEQPLLGALYLFSPGKIRKSIVGPLTGYTDGDLKPGGRLEGLVIAKDRGWEILVERMEAEGFQGDMSEWMRHAALERALENPLRYVASIGVFAYKGIWFLPLAGGALNILAVLCFFGLFFGAIFARNQVLVAAFGLPAGLFFFIATFTHALTRYTSPMTPFVIISVLWLIAALFRRAYRRSSRLRNFIDRRLPILQIPADAKNASQRRPIASTPSAETASGA